MSFNQSTYNVNEEDRLVTIVLVLSHPVSTSTTITVSTTDISAKGKHIYVCNYQLSYCTKFWQRKNLIKLILDVACGEENIG